ncbi:hypothetical protein A0H81_01887 [Grifola frondosa]|uniref:Uncharacterized protein n=1 Tax=Grifola frondosa TaxID=5627 RepID=A0A1C7MMN3_GRIFR|nr:hypothetical protein A0H81_01887 [Grifola frondosa]
MSRHFCFCIPVRAAVFFFSLISLLVGAVSAAAAWYLVWAIDAGKVEDIAWQINNPQDAENFRLVAGHYKTPLIIAGVIFTLVAVMSLFGFIGACARNRRMVKAYSFMTWLILLVSMAAAGLNLYAAFYGKPICVDVTDAQGKHQVCSQLILSTSRKIVLCVVLAIELLVNLYIVLVIRRYYRQLEDEQEYRREFKLSPTGAGTYEANQSLLNPATGHYPYSDASNAFGHKA